ncbi:MAG: hypothetical protein K0B81_05670 [Candidatus Cloacimonetes bacterium]|nr:hypothetical protein [Candidatus Cloacimonadota bacterium]
MYVMIIILKDESLVKKILSLLIEFELFQSTVVDGESIENIAARKIPLFSDFNLLFGRESVYNRTIICYVPDGETVERFIKVCRDEEIDFENKDIGCLFTIPCNLFLGQNPQ